VDSSGASLALTHLFTHEAFDPNINKREKLISLLFRIVLGVRCNPVVVCGNKWLWKSPVKGNTRRETAERRKRDGVREREAPSVHCIPWLERGG